MAIDIDERRAHRPDRLAPLRQQGSREGLARALVLIAAFISFVLSVSLWFTGSEQEGIFVGIWVPSILALGAMILPRPR
jgi:hypothetical protein